MADNLSREERVAAGLKKLKQFQQRANRKSAPGSRRKTTSKSNSPDGAIQKPSNNSLTNTVEASAQEELPESESSSSVPFAVISSSSLTSSSNPSLCNSASATVNSHKLTDRLANSEVVTKSKSDLDLSHVKELSSAESILQISQQINGLMSETHAFINGSIEQEDLHSKNESQLLEQRNQELASQVDCLQQTNDHLQFQIQEAKAKVNRLQREFENERQELHEKSHKEQVALKDQLQVHIQTIGILVAEKTELQSSLSLSQQTAKQKAAEVEELQGRLRASRQRANDLERELNNINASKQQFEKGSKESSKEIDRLKMENYKLGKNIEELKQQNTELAEKLSKKISEMQDLEKDLGETQSKLSLSELYAHQLSQGTGLEDSSQVEELYQQKLELEKKLSLQKESVDKLITERDQMSEQYQLYMQQLSQQVTSLRDELKHISEEKESLLKDRNSLSEKLEALQQSHDSSMVEKSEDLKIQLNLLEKKNLGLSKELETQVSDNAQMSNLLQEQESRISELESNIQRLKDEEIDKTRLLDSIQSEKVAASRAVAQNMELKRQLAELQNGFISVSNDKLELAEKLLSEQHITKELGERLSQQEEELRDLKDQVSIREEQLQNLHVSNTKGMYQQNQIADRMRHYEAQGQLAEMLQQELSQAKERINVLVTQNTELRMALAMQAESTVSTESSKEDKDALKRNNLVASLSTSVRQLEMERNQMMKQLEEQKLSRSKLEEQIKNKENQLTTDSNNSDTISKDEYEAMQKAMQQLEERFKKTMDEIAELTEERQRLEHLVLQLQGETETIGDYIALYQIQRGIMRKRASEKDDYIAQLAKDREDLKTKLSELQNLVMRLLEERKQFQSQGVISSDSSDFVPSALSTERLHSPDDSSHLLGIQQDQQVNKPVSAVNGNNSRKTENTAEKIMELLTEIGTTNLIEKPVMDNFHPCPVCSGRLITV